MRNFFGGGVTKALSTAILQLNTAFPGFFFLFFFVCFFFFAFVEKSMCHVFSALSYATDLSSKI